jgi:hypothetical protein
LNERDSRVEFRQNSQVIHGFCGSGQIPRSKVISATNKKPQN